MQTDLKKLDELQEEDVSDLRKQEIIYQILKEQLKKSRRELINMKKLKREQELMDK